MIQYKKDMTTDTMHAPRGGKGDVPMTVLLPTLPPNVTLCKRILLAPGCSVGEHPHEGNAEIYLPVKGTFVITDDGQEYTVSAGDAHCCFSGHTHAIENRGDEDAEFIALIITG